MPSPTVDATRPDPTTTMTAARRAGHPRGSLVSQHQAASVVPAPAAPTPVGTPPAAHRLADRQPYSPSWCRCRRRFAPWCRNPASGSAACSDCNRRSPIHLLRTRVRQLIAPLLRVQPDPHLPAAAAFPSACPRPFKIEGADLPCPVDRLDGRRRPVFASGLVVPKLAGGLVLEPVRVIDAVENGRLGG